MLIEAITNLHFVNHFSHFVTHFSHFVTLTNAFLLSCKSLKFVHRTMLILYCLHFARAVQMFTPDDFHILH